VTVTLFQRADRTYEALAGRIGLRVHQAACGLRHFVARTGERDPTNVAVLCDAFLRYGSGQAIGLSQAGLSVTLYYIDRIDEFGDRAEDRAIFLDRAQAAGVELVPLPRRRMRALRKHALWLHRDLRRRKVAVAVVQSHIDPRYATLGLALPVVLMLHDPQTHSGDTLSTFPAPVRLISRIAELTSFCLIIHSGQLLEQIRPILRRLPIGVVPHGTDMASAPTHIPRERRLLVFGRLFAYKGVDTALEAFRILPESLSDAKLIVAGRGPLAALARSQHNVEVYEEYITDPDVETLLKEARLVLLPYKDATQSGVGLQAVARGVPCVVSSAGALPELVPDSVPGLVVPPDDPARLAEAIVAHIDHDDRVRRAVYDHAAADFTWLAVARRLCSELQRLGLQVTGAHAVACTEKVRARS
jgi:glycosyltransferase involved in cell wall biosynthesis